MVPSANIHGVALLQEPAGKIPIHKQIIHLARYKTSKKRSHNTIVMISKNKISKVVNMKWSAVLGMGSSNWESVSITIHIYRNLIIWITYTSKSMCRALITGVNRVRNVNWLSPSRLSKKKVYIYIYIYINIYKGQHQF